MGPAAEASRGVQRRRAVRSFMRAEWGDGKHNPDRTESSTLQVGRFLSEIGQRRSFCGVHPPAEGLQKAMSAALEKAAVARRRFLGRIGPESQFYRLLDYLPEISFFAKDRQYRLMCA